MQKELTEKEQMLVESNKRHEKEQNQIDNMSKRMETLRKLNRQQQSSKKVEERVYELEGALASLIDELESLAEELQICG